MDPNAALAALRENIRVYQDSDDAETANDAAERVVEHAAALDEWLTNGGFLPLQWGTTLNVTPPVAKVLENLSTDINDELDALRRGKGDPLAALEDIAGALARLAAGDHTGLPVTP